MPTVETVVHGIALPRRAWTLFKMMASSRMRVVPIVFDERHPIEGLTIDGGLRTWHACAIAIQPVGTFEEAFDRLVLLQMPCVHLERYQWLKARTARSRRIR